MLCGVMTRIFYCDDKYVKVNICPLKKSSIEKCVSDMLRIAFYINEILEKLFLSNHDSIFHLNLKNLISELQPRSLSFGKLAEIILRLLGVCERRILLN